MENAAYLCDEKIIKLQTNLNLITRTIVKQSFEINNSSSKSQYIMYDKYQGQQFINFSAGVFHSRRFEVWANGQMIDAAKADIDITVQTIIAADIAEDSILVNIESNLLLKYLAKNCLFDTAYTNRDRILLSIIAQKTNYDNYLDYAVFVGSAPFFSRQEKIFSVNEPFACSLFMVRGQLDKVTFTTAGTRTLVEFYSE